MLPAAACRNRHSGQESEPRVLKPSGNFLSLSLAKGQQDEASLASKLSLNLGVWKSNCSV